MIAASKGAAADSLTLIWDPSTDPAAVGYKLYVGTQSGVYTNIYDVGNVTSYVLSNTVPGQRYYIAASTYEAGGLEGPRSVEITGYSDAPPVLTNPGNQATVVGNAVTLQLVGSDPYGEPVSYLATGLPSGLSLTESTGLITGAPLTAGTYAVTATVTDGVLSDSESITWSVTAPIVNLPPVLTNPGNQTGVAGQNVTLQLRGSDPENQPLSYSATGLPAGLTLAASTGLIGGVPSTAGTYAVSASVSDGNSRSTATFAWLISAPADTTKPVVKITSPTSSSTYTAKASLVKLGGTASDNVGVTQVSWSNNRGGSGVATGTSAWTATIALQKLVNVITVTAMDQAGNLASVTITVTR
jgi:hypothetical protein